MPASRACPTRPERNAPCAQGALTGGTVIWIAGEFERITPPHELVYTWRLEGSTGATERVTVRFETSGDSTEVVILHECIANTEARERHAQGWDGCLDGLDRYAGGASSA